MNHPSPYNQRTGLAGFVRSKSRLAALAIGTSLIAVGCSDRSDVSAKDSSDQQVAASSTSTTQTGTSTSAQKTAAAQNNATARPGTSTQANASAQASAAKQSGAKTADQATVVLDEERLNVQKREVDAGGVLITKDVETRQVNQPVELQREEVQIERLSPEQARERDLAANEKGERISEGQVYIPLTREEAVAQKEVQPREVIRAETTTTTERENVDATLRREVADVQRQGQNAQEQLEPTGRSPNPDQQAQQLEQRIRMELRNAEDIQLQDQQIEQIRISIDQNRVTLSGSVPNQQVASTIEQRVRQIEGVQSVQNQLRPIQ